jgi:tetratricopeptide (TPR) repeat protein
VPFLIQFQGTHFSTDPRDQLLEIIIAGAFGGLLYSLQNGKLNLPYIEIQTSTGEQTSHTRNVINLGVVADCLIGIGGSLVVFLILPGGDGNLTPIKFLATGTIGGYGGRSLLNQAISNISKRQDELEEQVDLTKEKLQAVEDKVRIDGETLKLLSRYLDKSLKLTLEQEHRLMDNIYKVSPAARTSIFREAQLVLYEHRFKDLRNTVEGKLVENTQKIFEKLRDSDKNNNNDRYPAHIAYARMSLGEWSEAIELLKEAKFKLEKAGYTGGDNIQNELVYDCNLVICQIKIDPFNKESILYNLGDIQKKLRTTPYKLSGINNLVFQQDNPILKWLDDNQIEPDTLEPKTSNNGIAE